jgi:hypothetical protein
MPKATYLPADGVYGVSAHTHETLGHADAYIR